MVQESGGTVAQDFAVLDVYRRYKQFKPQGIAELNEGGLQLAEALAAEIAGVVDEIRETSIRDSSIAEESLSEGAKRDGMCPSGMDEQQTGGQDG
jgi:hypothetical protein